MKILRVLVSLVLPLSLVLGIWTGIAPGQATAINPDCSVTWQLTGDGTSAIIDNRQQGCAVLASEYFSQGFSALTVTVQSAQDNAGAPSTWGTFAGTVVSGNNPETATTSAVVRLEGYYPWLRVEVSGTMGTGVVRGRLYGYRYWSSRVNPSGPPSGAAGGCLNGSYPNPGLANLTVAGGVTFVGADLCLNEDAVNFFWDNVNKQLRMGAGTALLPSITFAGSTTTGMYSPAANSIGWTISAAVAGRIYPTTRNWNIGDGATDRGYKLYVNRSGTVGTESILDTTATTGFTLVDIGSDGVATSALTTQLRVRAGASQGATPLQAWMNNGGATLASLNNVGSLSILGTMSIGANDTYQWVGRSLIQSPSDGVIRLTNNGVTDFSRIQLGGTTSSFPSLKRLGTELQSRLADDSGFADFEARRTQTSPVAISALPTCVAGLSGSVQAVNDALAPAWGVTVVAGGAAYAQVTCNGANWTVTGI